jgi:methyltransferase (TIGR00027 family)
MPRSHGDTWDLATSVGATATMVAAARAIATNADAPLIDDPFAEPLVRAVGVDFLTRWATGEIEGKDLDVEGAPMGLGHMPAAMASRTRYFDGFFADAAAAGIRQFVILASGLDARAYRLDWPADGTLYEIDQPQVLAFKSKEIAALGASPKTTLHSLAVDLRDDWVTALKDAGFDATQPSAWIAEGLLGYLPPEAQDALLDAITGLGAPGSRLATEAVPSMPDVDVEVLRDKMRDATAKWREHGFDLDFSELGYVGERHDVADYLSTRGWTSVGVPMSDLLVSHGLAPVPEADGDQPTMAGVVYYTSTRV